MSEQPSDDVEIVEQHETAEGVQTTIRVGDSLATLPTIPAGLLTQIGKMLQEQPGKDEKDE